MEYGFEYIISPLSTNDFFEKYYEKKPLIIKRAQKNYYERILTIGDVDKMLSNSDLIFPNVFLVKQSEGPLASDYTYNIITPNRPTIEGIVEKEKLFQLFSEGNTIVINSLERHSSNIHYLCFITEREFHARAQANIYLTPFNSQGFEAHWDTHDVLLLQVGGSKNWKLFESPVELPSKRQSFNGSWERTNPSHEFILDEGDLLYIPRGYIHEGSSTEKISLHITIGIHPTKYSELLKEILKNVEDEVFFRKTLPISGSLNISQVQQFQDEVLKYFNKSTIDKAIEYKNQLFITRRLIDATHRLSDYVDINNLKTSSTLKKRSAILFEIKTEKEYISIRFYNKSIKIPILAKPSIDYMLENEQFKIASIDENIDDAGKLTLCRMLVEEGFLSIVSLEQ